MDSNERQVLERVKDSRGITLSKTQMVYEAEVQIPKNVCEKDIRYKKIPFPEGFNLTEYDL